MTESRRNVRQDPEDPPPFPGLLPPVILSGVLARSGEDAGREGIWGGAAAPPPLLLGGGAPPPGGGAVGREGIGGGAATAPAGPPDTDRSPAPDSFAAS